MSALMQPHIQTAAGAARAQQGSAIDLPAIEISATPAPTGSSGGIDVNEVPSGVTIVTELRGWDGYHSGRQPI